MSYDILGIQGQTECSALVWSVCLDAAVAFGWVPAGTVASHKNPNRPWDGSYTSNDWQWVTDDDARAFSAALNRAIIALAERETLTDDQFQAFKILAHQEIEWMNLMGNVA